MREPCEQPISSCHHLLRAKYNLTPKRSAADCREEWTPRHVTYIAANIVRQQSRGDISLGGYFQPIDFAVLPTMTSDKHAQAFTLSAATHLLDEAALLVVCF